MTIQSHEHAAELYALVQERAATDFRLAHPVEFRSMLDGVTAKYRGERGGFRLRMSALTRACAEAGGLPDLATWLNSHSQEAA